MTTEIATSKLPKLARELIKSMRSGTGKRYAPRTVRVQFVPGNHVTVNVAAFSFNAVAGEEISRKPAETWMGSDGESNYTEEVTYRGLVTAHHGYGAHGSVTVYVPTGLSDESLKVPAYQLAPFFEAAKEYAKQIAAGDATIIAVLSDRALEG